MAEQEVYSAAGASAVMLCSVATVAALFSLCRYGLPVSELTVLIRQYGLRHHQRGMFSVLKEQVLNYWQVVIALLSSSLLVTAWGTLAEQRALRVISAAEAFVVLSLEPLFATFFSFLLLGEAYVKHTMYGGMLIILGCVWQPVGLAILKLISKMHD